MHKGKCRFVQKQLISFFLVLLLLFEPIIPVASASLLPDEASQANTNRVIEDELSSYTNLELSKFFESSLGISSGKRNKKKDRAIFSIQSISGTEVSGTISQDTTWTVDNSPYVVTSSVTVNTGIRLFIEPGVVIKFQSGSYSLNVSGTLIADGTPTERVYFTSLKDDSVGGDTNGDGTATTPNKDDWGFIKFTSSSINSILDNAVVRYAGNNFYDDALEIYTNSLSITNCVIKDIGGRGIYCSGEAAPLIRYNDIFNTDSYGIYNANLYQGVDARYNWWGTTSDLFNEIYGAVSFSPYSLTPYITETTKTEKVFGSNSSCGYAGEPVNTSSGNFTYEAEDISLPSKGFDLEFIRNYNSQDLGTDGPLGYGWTHNYNTKLRFDLDYAIAVCFPDGKRDTFTYAGNGNYNSPVGILEKLKRNSDGTYTLTFVSQDKLNFDVNGRLISQVDKYGNTNELTYNADGNLESVITLADAYLHLPSGRYLNFAYTDGRLTSISDTAQRTVSFGYTNGNLTSVVDLNGKTTTYTYDSNHQLLTIREPKASANPYLTNYYSGNKVDYQYDAFMNQTDFAYDTTNSKTTITDNRSNPSTHFFDDRYRSTQQTNELGFSRYFGYNSLGLIEAVTDENNHTSSFQYDTNGNTVHTTDNANHTTDAEYDLTNNNLLWSEDEAQVRTTYTYDPTGKFLTSISNPVLTTNFEYDTDYGLLRSITTSGSTTSYEYNGHGDLTKIIDPLNYETSFGYDSAGRMTSSTDANVDITSYTYDNAGNITSIIYPPVYPLPRHQFDFTYDDNGNPETFRDSNNFLTRYQYDEMDNLTGVVDALESTTTYSYDPNYNLRTVTDGRNNTTTYEYWANNLLKSIKDALNNLTQFFYDGVGNITKIIYPNTNETYYEYTVDNLLKKVTYKNEPTSYTYDYNPTHTLKSVVDNQGRSFAYGYNQIGWPTESTDTINPNFSGSFTVHTGYDSLGRPTSLKSSLETTITCEYNLRGDLTTLGLPSGNAYFTYDLERQKTNEYYPNHMSSMYVFDSSSRITNVSYGDDRSYGWGRGFSYTYDGNGNILTENDTRYGYDALNRLTSWYNPWYNPSGDTTTTYSYDPTGNLLSVVKDGQTLKSFTYNEANQITNTGFTYDLNGNLTSDGVSSYTYDGENRLTEVKRASDNHTIASYEYDYLGRRIKSTEETETTYFHYDGDNLIAESDPTGAITARYYYDDKDQLVAMKRGTQTYYYHFNVHGDVTDITDSQGAVPPGAPVNSYKYDPWGNIIYSHESVENPFKYAGAHGYYHDSSTGQYYLKARYYSPDIYRFLTKDPDCGDLEEPLSLNPYVYCEDNPVNMVDPDGDIVETIIDVASIGYSAYELYRSPNLVNLGYLGWDIVAACTPFVPGSWTVKSAKLVGRAGEVILRSGRLGKQARLRELAHDDKLSSALRGEVKRDINQIMRKKRKTIRVPKGYNLAHKRGCEARKGYGYKHSDLQTIKDHKTQHKHWGYK